MSIRPMAVPKVIEAKADDHDGLKGFKLFRQVAIATAVALMTASAGAHTTIPAVLMPQLTATDSDLPLSLQQSTWFSSMHALSAIFGSVSGGVLVHRLGPRRVILLQALPCIAGWILMSVACNYWMLLVSRVLVGFTAGLVLSASQVYLGESASPQIRGRLVCITGLLNASGCLLSYVGGYLLPWRWVPALPVLLFLLPGSAAMLLVPESPYWLVGRHRHEQARASLRVLRGDDQLASAELAIIASSVVSRSKPLSFSELAVEMRKVTVLVPFLTICALFVLRVMAGIITIMVYAVAIFEETGSALSSYESAVVIGLVRIVTSLLSVLYVSDRFGRRPLLLMSGLACGGANLCMASFLLLRSAHPDWPVWQYLYWLPLPIVVCFIFAFDLGFARTGWVLHSELLPSKVRAALSGPGVFTHFLASFVAVFTFPYITASISLGGTFCLYAMFSFLGFVVCYFLVPETKNQRLEVIEKFYIARFAAKQPFDEQESQSTKL